MKSNVLPIQSITYFVSPFMIFDLRLYQGRKTPIIEISGRKDPDSLMGLISYRPGWRKFVFSPYGNMVFDHSCLEDIQEVLLKVEKDFKVGIFNPVKEAIGIEDPICASGSHHELRS